MMIIATTMLIKIAGVIILITTMNSNSNSNINKNNDNIVENTFQLMMS